MGSQTKFNKDVVTDNHLYGDCDQNTLLSELYFHPEKARVKYLDKEDIESLGFKLEHYNKTSIYGAMGNTKKPYIIENFSPVGNNIYKITWISTMGNLVLFNGYIKNKSELKKLLKQLEI